MSLRETMMPFMNTGTQEEQEILEAIITYHEVEAPVASKFSGAPYVAQRIMLRRSARLRKLHKEILKHGGEEVLFCPGGFLPITDAERNRLLARGHYWPGKAKMHPMESRACHQNSKALWEQGVGELVNGFGLSDDGLWRPHSWILGAEGLVETTVRWVAYFGAILTPDEIAAEY